MERTTWETITAIIVGILLGALVAVSLWFVKSGKIHFALPQKTISPIATKKTEPKPNVAQSAELTVSQPQNYSVLSEKSLTLTGSAAGSSLILVSQNSGDTVLKADKNGSFKTEVTLIEGDNEINLLALWPNGETKEQKIIIVYQKK